MIPPCSDMEPKMAGVVGIAAPGNAALVEQTLARIEHRGGAGRSLRSLDSATLGQVWPEAQRPLFVGVEARRVALDGEVHNWSAIAPGAATPLEAVEMAYERSGPAFVALLDGPFALALAAPDGVFLARDVVGKSPLYWGKRGEAVCFASEVKALLPIVSEIHTFPPGHYHCPETGLVRFAEISRRESLRIPEEQVAQVLGARLVESVERRMRAGPVGAWLSGGIDSAALAALARRQTSELHTFASGLESALDLRYARLVAEYIGSVHHQRVASRKEILAALPEVIYHLESFDALLVRSSLMNYLVGRLASDHVPAVLSGEGGDELFAGYSYLKTLPTEQLAEELVDITRRLHNTALQRVDRCSASHGLVARTPFLDRQVLDYALRIPARMKIHRENGVVEKWILRRAMEGLLPQEVLTRPKAKFWEGAGVGEVMSAHAQETISDDEFARARQQEASVGLKTKEELFYFRVFREQFGPSFDPALVGRTKSVAV